MASALQQLLDNRMSLREASKTYNISLNSLKSRYRTAYKRRVSREPKILFEKGLHAQLVFHVEDHRARCLPFSHNDFCRFAFEVAEYLSLVDRYPHVFNKMTRMMNDKYYLTFRNSQNAAFTAIAGNGIDAFFEKYRQLIREFSIKPIKIISCTVVSVGMQVVEGENPRKLSVMLSIDAVGTSRIPPAFICSKNERPFQKFLYQDIPVGSLFFVNDTGDFCSETLLKWLEVVVQKIEPTRERPMILLIDSYVYPRNLALTQYTGRHHIRVLGLPASILNPFYQEPARPYREAYECACLTWLLGQRVTNFNDDRSFAVEAFSCAGLWPIPEGTEKKLCEAVSDREHENPKTGNKE